MKRFGWMHRMGGVAAGLVLALALVLGAPATGLAAQGDEQTDKIYLKDGRVIEGKIVRELDGSVWVDYSIAGVTQRGAFFPATAIDRIERDAAAEAPPTEPVRARDEPRDGPPAKRPGVTRGVVITLEGMVGVEFAAKPLEDAIPWLEEHEIDVVVLKINSGGGYLLEIEKMHDVLVKEYKPRFRTVAWIHSAISAAAMSAHVLEEIYFMNNGNYGACTGWSGALEAVEGYPLEQVLYMMEKASAEGQRAPEVMRSMQITDPLSYNRSTDGRITWYNTTEGEVLVNPQGRILTLDAVQAERCKFSNGTADDLGTLARLLGYSEVEWVGRPVAGEIFPISKVERDMRAWRDGVSSANENLQANFIKYQTAVENARGAADLRERGAFVGLARRHLGVIRRVAQQYPTLAFVNNLNERWFREQERMLRDLLRP